MADINKLRTFMETYGVAVRAGVLTPNIDDEIEIRRQFELPPVNDAVRAAWKSSNGVRYPVTVDASLEEKSKIPDQQQNGV